MFLNASDEPQNDTQKNKLTDIARLGSIFKNVFILPQNYTSSP